jgi:hypothetical protein
MTTASGYGGVAPTPGARVVTTDNHELGRVKEVSSSCFKVDVSMRPDYWLATSAIANATVELVQLGVSKDQLDSAKVDNPGHTGVHGHPNTTVV